MLQESAHLLHISAQRIIISSLLPICSHIVAHLMHISAHIEQTLPHIGDMRIMHRMAVWHISMQSSIMHIISIVMEPFFMHIIMVSMHMLMHMEQSSIHRCMDAERSIIIADISFLLKIRLSKIRQSLAFQLTPISEKTNAPNCADGRYSAVARSITEHLRNPSG
jgi:hypothetical protein